MDSPKLSNLAIARMLREIAAAYEVKGENRFKIRAYDTAADSVEHATSEIKDLWEEGRLAELPGVGEAISSHLDEYFRTGKVRHFKEIKQGLPEGMFTIFGLEGVGPKRAHKLAEELKRKDEEGLYKAAQQGRVAKLNGFGERSEKQILKAIERQRKEEGRMPLPTAFSIAEQLIEEISTFPGFVRADPLGSLRRMVETIGDVDLGVATKNPPETIARFLKLPGVGRVLAAGKAKVSVVMKTGHQVDLRVQDPESYGALLQYFTGSKSHNIHLRKIANSQGLSLSEYGISKYHGGKKIGKPAPVATEEEFYQKLGMPYIPPEIREDTGEIEAAQKGALPVLVKDEEIRGEVHVHTSNSPDGEVSAPEMVEEAVSLGREYVGISDHSPSVNTRGAEGARREIMKRKKEVEALRKKYRGKIEIFFGA
ncbi:MAG: helix-hairpin-helix domain-containing protein, partial [bacterium]|nr:helix-hairpin-helix domain-containing protein [bacterium]